MKKDMTKEYIELLKHAEFLKAKSILDVANIIIDPEFKDKNGNTLLHLTLAAFNNRLFCDYELLDPLLEFLMDNGFNQPERLTEKNEDNLTAFQLMYQLCHQAKKPCYDLLWYSVKEIEKKVNVHFTGAKVTNNFPMIFPSKTETKNCFIPDADEFTESDGLKLHERLKLTRDFFGTSRQKGLNQLVGNIGFIVSTKEYLPKDKRQTEKGRHQRKFITIPIIKKDWVVFKDYRHTEQSLFAFMSTDEFLKQTFHTLEKKGFPPGCKIYAIIIDLFSDESMCFNCQSEMFRIQGQGVDHPKPKHDLIKIFSEYAQGIGYFLPSEKKENPFEILPIKPYKLPLILRISAFRTTNVNPDYKKYGQENALGLGSHCLKTGNPSNKNKEAINLKYTGCRTIFHSRISVKNLEYGYFPLKQPSYKPILTYKNTVFSTDGIKAKESIRKDQNNLYKPIEANFK